MTHLIVFLIFFALVFIVIPVLALRGVFALRRRGMGRWLLAPFRAWTGMDETRRPKPQQAALQVLVPTR